MNIGFVATRLAGTDGVSLETEKLAVIARRMGHDVFYCAGELEGDVPGLLAPELHFTDPAAIRLGLHAFGRSGVDTALLEEIDRQAQHLKRPLRRFVDEYQIDFLIVQNAFAIPMQLALGQALTELLQETGLPGLAHSHDFYWERERFKTHCLGDFLDTYFPPNLPRLQHAVINSAAQRDLKARRGIDSVLIPNVFDFETPAPGIDAFNADFRTAIGLTDEDWLILQPTRVIARKGIELAIEAVARLNDPRAKLIITHRAGDEGPEYLHGLLVQAAAQGVDLRYVAAVIDDKRRTTADNRKVYALWDTYPHADLVTYPSLYEGFGNALLETIYFRLPALVNRYPVYAEDIGPLGFQFAEIDGTVTDEAVAQMRRWLEDRRSANTAVERNYALALENYSYRTLARLLEPLLTRT